MRRPGLLVAAVALALVPATASAQQPELSLGSGAGNAVLAAAVTYLETLYASDFDKLERLLAPEAVLRDPTAAQMTGGPVVYEGRARIITGVRSSSAMARGSRFEVRESHASGGYAVLVVTYRSELDGETFDRPGEWIPVEVSGVTVIRVAGDLVVEHIDYVDYAAMQRQVRSFLER